MVHAPLQPGFVHIDADNSATVHGDRERLRAAHPTTAGGQRESAGERAVEPFLSDRRESLVRALQDALGADINPRTRGHLPVHGQPEVLQPAELRPVGPVRYEVGVGDQDSRRPFVRTHDANRPSTLDQHRLVFAKIGEGAYKRVVTRPVACGFARTSVDNQIVRALGDLRVEVVLQHP